MTSIRELIRSVGVNERHSMLKELVNALSFQDRLVLSALISKSNDPFERLPIELILHIFNYLPLFEPWRLTLVCRSWLNVLSSHSLQRDLLARWERHGLADSAHPRDWISQQAVNDKLRRMQAWRLNMPFSKAEFPKSFASHEGWHQNGDIKPNTQAQRTLTLHGTRIAFLDSDAHLGDAVVVRDLVKPGSNQRLQAGARDKIMGIVLTDEVVAWVTYSARLYIQALPISLGPTETIRVPSASVTAFHADGNLVSLTLAQKPGDSSLLLIYDNISSKLIHLTIEHPSHSISAPASLLRDLLTQRSVASEPAASDEDVAPYSAPVSMLIDEHKGAIDLFYEAAIPHDPYSRSKSTDFLCLEHQRYHMTSGSLHRYTSASDSSLWLPVHLDPRLYSRNRFKYIGALAWPSPTGTQSQWCFGTYSIDPEGKGNISKCFAPIFDAALGVLSIHNYTLHNTYLQCTQGKFSLWKDTLQLYNTAGNFVGAYTTDDGSPHKTRQPQYRPRNSSSYLDRERSCLQDFVLNDSFLVTAPKEIDVVEAAGLVRVWCFEPDLEWAMDEKTEFADYSLTEMSAHAARNVVSYGTLG